MRKPGPPANPTEPPPGGRARERARQFARSRGLPEPPAPPEPGPKKKPSR